MNSRRDYSHIFWAVFNQRKSQPSEIVPTTQPLNWLQWKKKKKICISKLTKLVTMHSQALLVWMSYKLNKTIFKLGRLKKRIIIKCMRLSELITDFWSATVSRDNKMAARTWRQGAHICWCVLKLTCFIPSDVLQKNSAKETKAGSEVNIEMASGCKKRQEEIVKLYRLPSI